MKEITVKELKIKIDNQEDFQLIDIREAYEKEICNIGGELIPMGDVMGSLEKISKNKPVVLHCRSGKRSAAMVMHLGTMGFDNLYNLKGGILAWADEIDSSIPKY